MEIKELKCKSCGSNIHLEEGQEKGVCPFCGTEFVVENEEVKEEVNNKVEEKVDKLEEVKEVENAYEGPSVTVSIRYDFTTLKYYNMFSMKYKRHYPVLYLGLAALCIAYFVFSLITQIIPGLQQENANIFALFLMPAIFVLFSVYTIYLFINFEKTVDKNLTLHFNTTQGLTTIQARVRNDGIQITSSKNPTEPYTYQWPYITNIYEIKEYYYLYVGKQPIIISKDPNNIIEGDLETLAAIIKEQAATKPYKYIDKQIIKNPITYVHKEDMVDNGTVDANATVAEAIETTVEEKQEDINGEIR